MDSGTGAGGRSKRGRKRGNGWGSRKRNSTSSKDISYLEDVPPTSGGGRTRSHPPPVENRPRVSALQILSKESNKRKTRSSSPSPPQSGKKLRPKVQPPPAPAKLKRLQKQPVEIQDSPKNSRGNGRGRRGGSCNSDRAVTRRGAVIQIPPTPVCSLDMPDLSQLSTSPIFAQIKDEEASPPLPPIQLHKQGPQGQRPYQYGGGGDFHVPVPVPLTSQRDMVLSSLPNEYQYLPSFQSLFGKGKQFNPNQLVCLEVPATIITTPRISPEEQEEEEKRKEARRVVLGTSERLKNILKLPKAHKWVIYEWFYSDIDRVLFQGETDFETCLRECFPDLKARQMRRMEWCKVRQMMGKPRRSSSLFFEEEREQLAVRREKIRMMQGRKQVGAECSNLRLVPDEIPMMLTIGTSVSARVRKPQDGIFQGTVEGVDTSNNTYRICFGREGLGTCSIPDFEVRATSPPDTISTASFCLKIPRKGSVNEAFKFKFRNAALLQENLAEGLPKSPFPIDSMLGGFPLRCLELIVRQSKLLKAKRSKLGELSELNVEAEKMKTYGQPYPQEFRKLYALCIVEMVRINESLDKAMKVIQVYMEEIAEDAIQEGSFGSGSARGAWSSSGKLVHPEKVKENADKEAGEIVTRSNFLSGVRSPNILELVRNMASLMLQVKALGTENGERRPFELESMRETMEKMKGALEGENVKRFQNKVAIPVSRIMAGLCVNPKVEDDKTK